MRQQVWKCELTGSVLFWEKRENNDDEEERMRFFFFFPIIKDLGRIIWEYIKKQNAINIKENKNWVCGINLKAGMVRRKLGNYIINSKYFFKNSKLNAFSWSILQIGSFWKLKIMLILQLRNGLLCRFKFICGIFTSFLIMDNHDTKLPFRAGRWWCIHLIPTLERQTHVSLY